MAVSMIVVLCYYGEPIVYGSIIFEPFYLGKRFGSSEGFIKTEREV